MVQCRNCGTNGEFNYLCHKCRKENLDNEIMSIMAYVNPLSLEDQEIHSRSLTNLLGIDYSSYGISNSVEDPNDYENILNTSERPDDIREGENIKDRWMVEEEDIDTYEENENLYDDSDDFTESISDSTDEDENIVEEYEDDSEESVKKFNDPVILNEEKIKALEEIFNSRNTVVRTRAGSGKSTLLLSLVNRLINEHDIEKDNILLLSFNKAVREKNAKTLREKWGVHDFYGVQTFHSLALQIVRPDRANIIEDQHNDYRLVELVGNLIRKEANMWFKLRYWRYLRELDKEMEEDDSLLTLLGEYVKSYGEKEIANYLFEYGIKYKYEPSFDWDGKQYRPDFMIEDGEHSAIIEYWGRNDDRYKEQMVSKRQYWRRKDKTLIEMYPDDFKGQGQKNITNFKNVLRDKLLMFGFSPHLLTEEERAEGVFRERFMSITKALLGFIQYARMQLKSPDEID